MPSSRESSRPRDQTCISYVTCIGRQVLYYFTTLLLKNANHNLSLQGIIIFVLVEGLTSMLIAAE